MASLESFRHACRWPFPVGCNPPLVDQRLLVGFHFAAKGLDGIGVLLNRLPHVGPLASGCSLNLVDVDIHLVVDHGDLVEERIDCRLCGNLGRIDIGGARILGVHLRHVDFLQFFHPTCTL